MIQTLSSVSPISDGAALSVAGCPTGPADTAPSSLGSVGTWAEVCAGSGGGTRGGRALFEPDADCRRFDCTGVDRVLGSALVKDVSKALLRDILESTWEEGTRENKAGVRITSCRSLNDGFVMSK